MHRRAFLRTAAASLPVGLAFAEQGQGTLKLGFDTYSLRAFQWKALQFLDYAGSQKLNTIQFSSLDDYESRDPAYLKQVREKAARLGIAIDGGTGCICPVSKSWGKRPGTGKDAVLEGLRIASAVGATSMRCLMGSMNDRRTDDPHFLTACMEETIRVFRSCKSEAQDLNVRIALENHA